MKQRVWAAMLAASLGWGSSGVATRAAFDEGVPPFALVLVRTLLALAGIVVIIRFMRRHRGAAPPRSWRLGVVTAVANLTAPFIFFTLALQYASAGFVGVFAAVIPLATAVFAHFLLDNEPLVAARVVGLVVGLAGVAVLVASGDSGLGTGEDARPLLAVLLSAAGIASISYASVYLKRHAQEYEPIELTAMQFAIGAVLMAVVLGVVEGVPSNFSASGWWLIIYLAAAGTLLPFILFFWILQRATATFTSLIGYLIPIVSVVAGVMFLDERLEAGIIGGGILILTGVVLTDRVEQRFSTRKA